ncbi:hypothetical protein BDZ88DRAFT_490615 [Geranomyces variabilis]|nr:hypothetical protein BDZ88DRAFT_490615 [Geranomyces variabilis]
MDIAYGCRPQSKVFPRAVNEEDSFTRGFLSCIMTKPDDNFQAAGPADLNGVDKYGAAALVVPPLDMPRSDDSLLIATTKSASTYAFLKSWVWPIIDRITPGAIDEAIVDKYLEKAIEFFTTHPTPGLLGLPDAIASAFSKLYSGEPTIEDVAEGLCFLKTGLDATTITRRNFLVAIFQALEQRVMRRTACMDRRELLRLLCQKPSRDNDISCSSSPDDQHSRIMGESDHCNLFGPVNKARIAHLL